jgi:hypothetical protein
MTITDLSQLYSILLQRPQWFFLTKSRFGLRVPSVHVLSWTTKQGIYLIFLAHIYTLNSVISTSLMSLLLWCPENLRNGCSQFESHSLLSRSLPYIKGLDILNHHRIQTTHSHASHVIIVIIAMVTLWGASTVKYTKIMFQVY